MSLDKHAYIVFSLHLNFEKLAKPVKLELLFSNNVRDKSTLIKIKWLSRNFTEVNSKSNICEINYEKQFFDKKIHENFTKQ